jgi:hypothetical protein
MFEIKTITTFDLQEFHSLFIRYRKEGFKPLGGTSTLLLGGKINYTITLEKFTQEYSSPE